MKKILKLLKKKPNEDNANAEAYSMDTTHDPLSRQLSSTYYTTDVSTSQLLSDGHDTENCLAESDQGLSPRSEIMPEYEVPLSVRQMKVKRSKSVEHLTNISLYMLVELPREKITGMDCDVQAKLAYGMALSDFQNKLNVNIFTDIDHAHYYFDKIQQQSQRHTRQFKDEINKRFCKIARLIGELKKSIAPLLVGQHAALIEKRFNDLNQLFETYITCFSNEKFYDKVVLQQAKSRLDTAIFDIIDVEGVEETKVMTIYDTFITFFDEMLGDKGDMLREPLPTMVHLNVSILPADSAYYHDKLQLKRAQMAEEASYLPLMYKLPIKRKFSAHKPPYSIFPNNDKAYCFEQNQVLTKPIDKVKNKKPALSRENSAKRHQFFSSASSSKPYITSEASQHKASEKMPSFQLQEMIRI